MTLIDVAWCDVDFFGIFQKNDEKIFHKLYSHVLTLLKICDTIKNEIVRRYPHRTLLVCQKIYKWRRMKK